MSTVYSISSVCGCFSSLFCVHPGPYPSDPNVVTGKRGVVKGRVEVTCERVAGEG